MEYNETDPYKSHEGRRMLHDLYRKHLVALKTSFSEELVETSFGDTHVVFYGAPSGTPVVCFHSPYMTNPLSMRPFIKGLDLRKMRLIVPDVPESPGFTSVRHLRASKGEYGQWALDLTNRLGFREITVLGYSFGAHIALQLCAESLLSVKRLLLVQPAGFCSVSSSKIEKALHVGDKEERKSGEMSSSTSAPVLSYDRRELTEMADMLSKYMRPLKHEWKEFKKRELNKFRSPVGLIAEKSDRLFPGDEIVKQARKMLPFIEMSIVTRMGDHYGLFGDDEHVCEAMRSMSAFLLRGADEELV